MVALLDQTLITAIAAELEYDGTGGELCPQLGIRDPVIHDLARVLLATMVDPGPASTLMVDALSRAMGVHICGSAWLLTPNRRPRLTPSCAP
jgi:hypothetical protein